MNAMNDLFGASVPVLYYLARAPRALADDYQ